jgi:hypothetical protein
MADMVNIPNDIRDAILYVLRWNFFGVAGGLVLAGAFSVMSFQQWNLASWLFALTWVWALGHFFTSDFLREKQRAIHTRKVRRDALSLKRATTTLWSWAVSISLILTLTCIVCEYWVQLTKRTYERDDVFRNLTIEPQLMQGKDARETTFTITNRSSYSISNRHRLACIVNRMAVPFEGGKIGGISNIILSQTPGGGFTITSGGLPVLDKATLPNFARIEPGGDSQTDSCLSLFNFATKRTACADIVLRFDYELEGQPNRLQTKSVRLIYGGNLENHGWVKEPVESTEDFCSSFISNI